MTLPLIGVSGWIRTLERVERGGVNSAYLHAVARAGGVPLVLTPPVGTAGAPVALEGLDGLLLTGGSDIDPSCYGMPPSPQLHATNPARDAFELALFHEARQRGLPVLGVCRGLQLVNVAMGGTLHQDLPTERPGPINHDPDVARDHRVHGVRVVRDSRLAQVLGATMLETNSFHHQAIARLAPGLTATGWAGDEVIEGIEGSAGEPWLLAVQWHPEEFYREENAPDQRLFGALVEAAAARRRTTQLAI